MKTLFIGPRFYSYHKAIINEISKSSDVIFYSEVPYGGKFYFGVKRFFPSKTNFLQRRYAEKLFNVIKTHCINQLFIIRGYGIDANLLKCVKLYNPNITIINCQWDAIANNPNGYNLSQWADRNYTFDIKDAEAYNWNYLPLFYNWEKLNNSHVSIKKDIDILFVGAYHSNRSFKIKELNKYCIKNNINFKYYIYVPFYTYIRDFLFTHSISFKDIKFRTLNRTKYILLLQRSKSVLDIQYCNQSGLTIRTIEALSIGTKVITTNPNILESECYNKNNVFIWNEISYMKINLFLRNSFDTSQKGLIDLHTWLKRMSVI